MHGGDPHRRGENVNSALEYLRERTVLNFISVVVITDAVGRKL